MYTIFLPVRVPNPDISLVMLRLLQFSASNDISLALTGYRSLAV